MRPQLGRTEQLGVVEQPEYESPERVALIKQATPAYLRTSLASTTARGLPRVKPWPRLAAEGSG